VCAGVLPLSNVSLSRKSTSFSTDSYADFRSGSGQDGRLCVGDLSFASRLEPGSLPHGFGGLTCHFQLLQLLILPLLAETHSSWILLAPIRRNSKVKIFAP
jgi:hypothetical protein